MNDQPLSSVSRRYDAIVVGARCAGAATALLLARAGARVLVLDQATYGTDTLSTHALMRGAVTQLHRWAVLDRITAAGTPPIRRTSFHYESGVVDVDIRARGGVDALYAPRRTLLDRVLVDAASAAGAVFRYGVSVGELVHREGRVDGVVARDRASRSVAISGDLVIGADGRTSRIASLAGAETLREGAHTSALLYGYFDGLPGDAYRWYWAENASAGLIPTNDGVANVFVATRPERLRGALEHGAERAFAEVLRAAAPELEGAVTSAHRHGALRMFRGQHGVVRAAHGPGWALVGDAGYFRDPLTAHGISDALRDAEMLARSVLRGSLSAYAEARDALALPMLDTSDAIASFDWDAPRIQELHARLNAEMKASVRAVEAQGRLAA